MKKTFWIVCLAIVAVAFSILYYSFAIEPYQLVVENLQYGSGEETDLRIAVFSDTHFKKDYPVEQMERIAEKINEQNPDLVLFTGDLYDNYDTYHEDDKLVEYLSQIQAPLGKLAVRGNRDYGGGAQNEYVDILDRSGFTLLQNSNWYIPLDSQKTVLFTGVDDALLGDPVLPCATRTYDSDFDILVVHEPEAVPALDDGTFSLAVCGHTHGGQTSLPLLQNLYTQNRIVTSEDMKEVFPDLQIPVHINTGIGTSHISARFLMPPTISVIDINLE